MELKFPDWERYRQLVMPAGAKSLLSVPDEAPKIVAAFVTAAQRTIVAELFSGTAADARSAFHTRVGRVPFHPSDFGDLLLVEMKTWPEDKSALRVSVGIGRVEGERTLQAEPAPAAIWISHGSQFTACDYTLKLRTRWGIFLALQRWALLYTPCQRSTLVLPGIRVFPHIDTLAFAPVEEALAEELAEQDGRFVA